MPFGTCFGHVATPFSKFQTTNIVFGKGTTLYTLQSTITSLDLHIDTSLYSILLYVKVNGQGNCCQVYNETNKTQTKDDWVYN